MKSLTLYHFPEYFTGISGPSVFARFRGADVGPAFGGSGGQSDGHGSYNAWADERGYEFLVDNLTAEFAKKGLTGTVLQDEVQKQAKSIFASRIESNQKYWKAEVKDSLEMETEYVIRVNDEGQKELYHEGFHTSLSEMLKQSEIFSRESNDPRIFNREEAKALLEMEKRIVNGETKSDLNPTWHPTGVKYFANMELKGEPVDGAKVKVSYVNVGAIYGRNLTMTEARAVMEQIKVKHVDDVSRIDDQTGHAYLSLEKTTVQNYEISDAVKTVALRSYLKDAARRPEISRDGAYGFGRFAEQTGVRPDLRQPDIQKQKIKSLETGIYRVKTERKIQSASWTVNAVGTLMAAEFISRKKKLEKLSENKISILDQVKAISLKQSRKQTEKREKPNPIKTGKPELNQPLKSRGVTDKIPAAAETAVNPKKPDIKIQTRKFQPAVIFEIKRDIPLIKINRPERIFRKPRKLKAIISPDFPGFEIPRLRKNPAEAKNKSASERPGKYISEMKNKPEHRPQKIRREIKLRLVSLINLVRNAALESKPPINISEKSNLKFPEKRTIANQSQELFKLYKSEKKRLIKNKIRLIQKLKLISGSISRGISQKSEKNMVRSGPAGKTEIPAGQIKNPAKLHDKNSLYRPEIIKHYQNENILMLGFLLVLFQINRSSLKEKTVNRRFKFLKQIMTLIKPERTEKHILRTSGIKTADVTRQIHRKDSEKDFEKVLTGMSKGQDNFESDADENRNWLLLAIILYMTKIREQRAPQGGVQHQNKKTRRTVKSPKKIKFINPDCRFLKQGTIFVYGS